MLSARARKALLISGAVTTAVGGGLIGVMAYGLYQGDLADQAGVEARARDPYDPDELQRIRIDGENANKLAIGAGVAGGLLAATGVALIVTSRVGRARQLALSPATSPRLLGVTLRGRF
ncbi:MAG: hypothetical protein H6713_30210 [Myxococcales bacterium]|nr:hypothetical protein [Myxococcales bacterium]